MKTRDFYFNLPESQIAQHPSQRRSESRLMVIHRDSGRIVHTVTDKLDEFLDPPMVMVRNNTRVRKARVHAEKHTGSCVEFLFISQKDEQHWEVMVSKSARQRIGDRYRFPGGLEGVITAASDAQNLRILQTSRSIDETYFLSHGHMPLPPYIRREDQEEDLERYQTVYASSIGSVAAPTAGLHMTENLEGRLREKGIAIVDITLHVGIGTFVPIRSEHIEDHRMHHETYTIGEKEAEIIAQAKQNSVPVLVMGTTSMRCVESAWEGESIRSGTYSTDLYIKPGYEFKVADAMFTNFHTPGSTLMVLVCTFGGKQRILDAYNLAVSQGYRFFSYGDAMLIL